MPWFCMTCTAMYGNGAVIGTMVAITVQVLITTRRDLLMVPTALGEAGAGAVAAQAHDVQTGTTAVL